MYVQQSGGPNSSNRSVSLSMDDSATLHLHQVNQKMKIVNEQQLHVRKPSEKEIQKCDHCSALQDKSPALTSLTPQLPSDRVNGFQGTEIKDLLLINEEPSVKEQSLQIGNVVPNKILSMEDIEQGQEQSALKQNIVIDEKLRNSFSEVRWSKMVSSKSNPTNTQYKLHQFSIISDKGAQFIINHLNKFTQFLQKLTNPQKHNNLIQLLYRFLVGVFQIYYFSVILLELQQQQVNIIKNPLCQFLIFFTQIYEIFLKFTSIQYQNGIEINKLTQNFKIYVQFRIYIDIITIIPFIFYLSNADYSWIYILYLIRLIDIKESLIMLSQLINSINFAFFAQIIIELHFLINLCGAVINQLTSQNRSIQQIGILYIFQNNQQAEIGIQYLVYVIQLLLICYFLFLVKQILKYDQKDQINLKQLTIDQNQKLQLVQQLQSLEEKSDQISVNQYLDVLPTKEQENIKFPQYSKYLKSLQIFKNSFSEPTFQKLTTLMQEFTLPPNSHIISPHSRNQSLFFIISGNIQIYQNNSEAMFRLHIIGENQTFNNQAFFMNQLPNIGAKTIGYCRILQLDYDLFQDLLQKIHFEKQKYKMIVDKVCLYQHYYLAGIKCYACHQHHDINNCSNVHYIPNPTMLIQYIHENEQMHRINYIRKKTRSDRLNKANIFKIEDAALLFQQFNVESELSNYERQIYRSEYQPSINKQLTTPFSSPNHDNDDKQVSNQAIPAVVEEDRSMPQQQALELNNISPVPHIQQPPSGFSHSSYQYLLKDVSITYNNKKPKLEGSDKEKNSSNMFSIPYSSSGTSKNNLKNSKNSEILAQYKQQEQQEKEEQLSIQLKKAKAQDSLFYNQKRLFKHRNSGSQNDNQSNSSSKYKKYYTGIQQSQKSERSERKSNSMINDYISERGLLQQYLDQKNNEDNRQQSRNGIQSSKFTGETAKQFMHNPLEMPNIDFYQSFEKSNQFSDYFPGQNIDQAIESYKQYQASRSSLYNYMEPLQNPGQLPNSQLDQNVLRQKIIIQALCCFCFIYCTIYLQALCMISKVCGMDGTEAPLFAEQSIIAFYVFTLLFLLMIYHSVDNVKQNIITYLKWPVLLYAIVAGIFGIVCFIQNGTIQKSDLIQNWNKLSQYRRTNRYTSSIDNLLSYNKLNLIIIAIYHIIYAIVLGIIFGFLFNFQMIMPQNWRPPFQSRLIVPSPLIYKPQEFIQQQSKLHEEEEKIDEEKEDVPAPITVFQQQKPKTARFQRKQVSDVEAQSQLQQSQLQQSQVDAPF